MNWLKSFACGLILAVFVNFTFAASHVPDNPKQTLRIFVGLAGQKIEKDVPQEYVDAILKSSIDICYLEGNKMIISDANKKALYSKGLAFKTTGIREGSDYSYVDSQMLSRVFTGLTSSGDYFENGQPKHFINMQFIPEKKSAENYYTSSRRDFGGGHVSYTVTIADCITNSDLFSNINSFESLVITRIPSENAKNIWKIYKEAGYNVLLPLSGEDADSNRFQEYFHFIDVKYQNIQDKYLVLCKEGFAKYVRKIRLAKTDLGGENPSNISPIIVEFDAFNEPIYFTDKVYEYCSDLYNKWFSSKKPSSGGGN